MLLIFVGVVNVADAVDVTTLFTDVVPDKI